MNGRMLACGALLGTLAAFCARAEDWDQDRNIQLAVEAFVAVETAAGIDAAEKFVDDCYRSVDSQPDPDRGLRRLEYCAGMDFAGFLLARQTAEASGAKMEAYFQPEAMFQRLQPLARWVEDPAEQSQILRAWSRGAAEALEERMQ